MLLTQFRDAVMVPANDGTMIGLGNVRVTVVDNATGANASIYDDLAGALPKTNPFNTAAGGKLSFFAAPNTSYSIELHDNEVVARMSDEELVWEPGAGSARHSPGDLKWSAAAAPQAGWLLCDGSAISRTTYADLFGVISTTFGAGNGSTTFNVPDYRGRVLVGKGTHAEVSSLANNDGLAVGSRKIKHKHGHSLSISGGSHTHTISDPGHAHGGSTASAGSHSHGFAGGATALTVSGAWANYGSGGSVMGTVTGTDSSGSHTHSVTVNSATTGVSAVSSTHTHANGEFSGTIGDSTGPTDGPAYGVGNIFIKV